MNAVYPDNNTTNNKHTSGVGLPHSIPPPGAPTQQTQHRRRLNRIQFFRAFYYFHTSPVVKFCYHTISNIVFLGLFSFFLLTDLRPHSPSVYEYIVWVWALTMFVEELRQFMSHDPVTIPAKLASYFRSAWNRFDQIVYLFFLVSVILRWSLDASNFVWARMFYASTLTLYFLRFLQVFFIEKKIGPKVIMIRRMVTDLAFFLLLLAVFLFSYGIAAQALMYPNSTPSWNILLNVVYFPYFSIYGDMNLDELQGDVPDCTNNATIYEDPNSGVPRCSEHSWLAVLMFAVYLLLTNILLINLLIAMFSYTFSKVQENSERMWRFYRFGLIYEYYDKSTLAPPLIILCHVWQIMVYIYQSCCRRTRERINTDFHKHLDVDSVEDKQLDVSDSTLRPTDKHQINGNNGNNGATQSTVQHKDKQLDVDSDRQLTAFERAGLNTFRQTPDQQEQWDNSVNTAGQRSNSSQQQQLNRLMNKLESMEQKMREISDSLTKTNNTAITET